MTLHQRIEAAREALSRAQTALTIAMQCYADADVIARLRQRVAEADAAIARAWNA